MKSLQIDKCSSSVCVLHIKAFFRPVDIQHTQCPCRFFILERYELCGPRPTPQPVGWTVTGPSLAGRLHSLGFCSWVSSRKSHTTRRRGHLLVVFSTVPDPSGSGRVDMLTSPIAAARAAVATGAWVKSCRLNRHTTTHVSDKWK